MDNDDILTCAELAAWLQMDRPIGEFTRSREQARSTDPLPVFRIRRKQMRFGHLDVAAYFNRLSQAGGVQ